MSGISPSCRSSSRQTKQIRWSCKRPWYWWINTRRSEKCSRSVTMRYIFPFYLIFFMILNSVVFFFKAEASIGTRSARFFCDWCRSWSLLQTVHGPHQGWRSAISWIQSWFGRCHWWTGESSDQRSDGAREQAQWSRAFGTSLSLFVVVVVSIDSCSF